MEKSKLSEYLIEKGLFVTAVFSIIIILLIILFILIEGLPAFEDFGFFRFLFGMEWAPSDGQYGVFAMIIGSIYVTLLSLLMAVPLSLFCAIFMAEVAPNSVRKILKPVIETLSGIPSVVYGFFGLIVLVPIIRSYFGGTGFSLFTASLILTVQIL
jgi:phosphate transport system permease protein